MGSAFADDFIAYRRLAAATYISLGIYEYYYMQMTSFGPPILNLHNICTNV
jgi:hypothetical protein